MVSYWVCVTPKLFFRIEFFCSCFAAVSPRNVKGFERVVIRFFAIVGLQTIVFKGNLFVTDISGEPFRA
jgi:hypothetical protein